MPLQPHGPAPYTSVTSATTVLDAWRDRGFAVPVTPETLARVGVQESLARRTFQSLVGLDLIDTDGKPTQQLEDFRLTRGDDEYKTRLQEWLRSVYADILQYADPSTATYERLTEAFRSYEPAGQRRAMASLFLGLWKYAGLSVIGSGASGEAGTGRAGPPRRPLAKRVATPRRPRATIPGGPSTDPGLERLPPGLVGLLHQIPRDG